MMKKFVSGALSAMMIFSSASAFAMQAKQEGDKTVILTGNAGKGNVLVALDVYANGKTKDDLISMKENGENILNAIVARTQTKADENGDFEVRFDIGLATGKYTVFSGSLDNELEPYTFVFVSDKEYSEIAKNFKDAQNSYIKDIIDDNNKCYILGITEEEADAINSSKLAGIILKTISESGVDTKDRDAVWAQIDKAYFVQQVNEGIVEDVLKADDKVSGIAESGMSEWFEKEFVVDEVIENFNERLKEKEFESYKEYEKSLMECYILAVVENAEGIAEIEEVITAFEDEIDVNVTSSVPERVWNKLFGNDYDSIEDLAEAFEDFVEEGNAVGSSSSSSSGGGGSKGSGSKGTAGVAGSVVSKPVLDNKAEENKLSLDIFDDIDNFSWAKEAIIALAEKNIISGVGDNKFNPGANVTREQFAKIVVGAFTPDAEVVTVDFTDVVPGAWYADFVAKAYAKGITSGMGNGKFGVGEMITRQDMCVMIYNAAKASGKEMEFDKNDAFDDDAQIAEYAKDAVYALKAKGAISGVDGKNFAPRMNATRAEAAKIIYALIK